MTLHPNLSLSFDGRCEAAFTFYARCLGGRIDALFRYGGSPLAGDAPPDWADKVMHAWLVVGDTRIAGADVVPAHYQAPQGFSILLGVADRHEAERIFHALAANGKVTMPIQETFWA